MDCKGKSPRIERLTMKVDKLLSENQRLTEELAAARAEAALLHHVATVLPSPHSNIFFSEVEVV